MRKIKKLLCWLLGHKWVYRPKTHEVYKFYNLTQPMCWCKRCRLTAPNQWEIYQKYFKGKPEGSFLRGKLK